jgi:2-oxoglutarate ferredoxin oxidoreductase subunit gamma
VRKMKRQLMVAGHGEQGVQQLGEYLGFMGVLKGLNATYGPTHGPEERDEKVKCTVTISSEEVDAKATEEPDYLIAMNAASLDYLPLLRKGGTLLVNSSLAATEVERDDIDVYRVPATEIAMTMNEVTEGIRDTRALANSVMLGVYLALVQQEPEEVLLREVYGHFLASGKEALIKLNIQAVRRGYEFARSSDPLVEYGR